MYTRISYLVRQGGGGGGGGGGGACGEVWRECSCVQWANDHISGLTRFLMKFWTYLESLNIAIIHYAYNYRRESVKSQRTPLY